EVAISVATCRTKHPLDARTLARLAVRHAGEGPGGAVGFGLSNDERRGDTADFGPAFQIAARAGLMLVPPGRELRGAGAGTAVVGLGLSNDARRGDTGDFGPAFQIAARGGLMLVPHGGELRGPEHVRAVVAHLHPDRLGHGVRASEDPRLLEHLVDDGIAFEVCPASNVSLGVYEDAPTVPLRTLMGAGAQIALGADDPLLFGSRLLDQYRIAREVHGCTDAELAELAASSIRASRAGAATKERLLEGVRDWLASPVEVPAEQVRASG